MNVLVEIDRQIILLSARVPVQLVFAKWYLSRWAYLLHFTVLQFPIANFYQFSNVTANKHNFDCRENSKYGGWATILLTASMNRSERNFKSHKYIFLVKYTWKYFLCIVLLRVEQFSTRFLLKSCLYISGHNYFTISSLCDSRNMRTYL